MYVSGTLKKKTIDFYREQIVDYNEECFDTSDFSIYYTGEIITTPWNQEKLNKLENHQEQIIRNGIEKTYALINCLEFPKSFKDYLKSIVKIINNTPRNITFILFECYYNILKKFTTFKELNYFIQNIPNFISYVENLKNLNQNELELMVKSFISQKDYTFERVDLKQVYEQDLKLYNLATFIARERIKKVSSYFNRGLGSDYPYLFLYFALKDANLASLILEGHIKNPEKELKLKRVPKTLQETMYLHNPE